MRKNPFSLYDFLGYVFPGALSIVIIYFFTKLNSVGSVSSIYADVESFLNNININGKLSVLEETVMLTIAAYIMGHFVAYVSSITVEKFAIWTYGYPSEFLLKKIPSNNYWRVSSNSESIGNQPSDNCCSIVRWYHIFVPRWYKSVEFTWRAIIALFLFPISLCTVSLGKLLNMKSFFVKQLDDTLKSAILTSQRKLADSLGISLNGEEDFHRIVYHYEYEKQSNHVFKLDNYVALYGFLRAITFIANCFTLWLSIRFIFPTIKKGGDVDWHLVFLFILCVGVTYIFFMSFMKFYRRFTLESFMCLVIDSSFKEVPQQPYNLSFIPENSVQTQNISQRNYNGYSPTTENTLTDTTVAEANEVAQQDANSNQDEESL